MRVKVRPGPDGKAGGGGRDPRRGVRRDAGDRQMPGLVVMDPEAAEVKASGGVVWRRGRDGPEVVLVHRPRYDDWSLPKGKLDAGETWEAAALREVAEEVGLRCRLGDELPPVRYRDNKGRDKAVRYWLMEPEDDAAAFTPNDEVDEMRWIERAGAAALLSYPRDAELVRIAQGRV
jgi:8-oxo-dGTP diphosphatase